MTPDPRLWRNPWQVIRQHHGTVTVLCSHRWEWTARTCAARRDTTASAAWHDYRRTPARNGWHATPGNPTTWS